MTEHPTSPDGGNAPVGDAHPSSPDRSAGSSPSNGPGSLSARPPGHLPPDQDWWARPSGALSRPGWVTSNPETSPHGAAVGAEGPVGGHGPRVTGAGTTPPAGGPDPSTQVFGPGGYPGQASQPTDRTYADGAYGPPGFRTAGYPAAGYGAAEHGTTAYGAAGSGAVGYAAAGYGAAGPGGDRGAGYGTATAAGPRPSGRRRSTGLIGGATVLALASAFGAGYLGSQVGTSPTTAATSDSSVVRSSVSAPAVAQVIPSNGAQTVAQSVLPSVVSVVAVSGQGVAEGSGVILSADGKILTNNHVISGSQQLTVRLNDGTTARADVVGGDATDDLAVIQAKGLSGLKPATIGSSGGLSVGQEVVAIGSPLGLSSTVTSGIVSALNRPVRTADAQGQQNPYNQNPQQGPQSNQDPNQTIPAGQDTVLNAIQTDAAINHGNSGGALVDMTGKVIGINSAIASASSGDPSGSGGGNIGIGFAIPIDQAKRIADEIIASGYATHAVLGATVGSASTAEQVMSSGATIASVTSGGAAEKAGLQKGDVVTKVGNQQVESSDALVAAVRSQKPGGTVDITYVRDKKSHTVSVTLGSAKSQ